MADGPDSRPVPLRSRRDETIQVLCAEFAQDNLTLDEFERRLDIAHRATALTELDELTADLRTRETNNTALAPAPPRPAPPTAHSLEDQTLIALMGGVDRRGRWIPAHVTSIIALMGGAHLDFREVQLPPGTTELNIFCVMGGVEIIVPPGMAIDTGGIAIMGGFEQMSTHSQGADAGAPILKVSGFVFMGGVDIQVREPGESAKEARHRQRAERRNRRT